MKRKIAWSALGVFLLVLIFAMSACMAESEPDIPVREPDVPVRAVVLYNGNANPDQMETALRDLEGVTFLWNYESIFYGAAVEAGGNGLRALEALDGVAEVRQVRDYLPSSGGETDGAFSSDSALAIMGALGDGAYTGDGVVIAVLDSGLNTGHEVFADDSLVRSPAISREDAAAFAAKGRTAGQYVSSRIPFVYDYYSRDTDVSTREGHGTHVAALAAGYARDGEGNTTFQGAAPGAQILGMKIFPDNSGGGTDDAVILRALEDAWNLGADVINISVGTGAGFCWDGVLDGLYCKAFAQMTESGVIICCSAGNEGTNTVYKIWTRPLPTGAYTDYGTVTSPGSYRGVVAVAAAAVGRGGVTMAGYSSWGPASELHLSPAITAFGGPVTSAGASSEDVYYNDYGTSMASGSTSGLFAAALQALRARGVTDKAEAARLAAGLLESTARVLTDENGVPFSPRKQGAGLVDLEAALSSELVAVNPLMELGDSEEGRFTLSFTLRNLSGRDTDVSLDVQTLTDGHLEENGSYYSTLSPRDITGRVDVSGSRTVNVPAGGETEVTLELTVSKQLREELAEVFPSGFYVEGYVTASGNGQTVHGTFLGYCGDWEAAPVLDAPDFRDLQDAACRLAGDVEYVNPLQNPTAYLAELGAEVGVNLAYLPARGSDSAQYGRLLGANGHAYVLHDDSRSAIPGQGTNAMYSMERQLCLELYTLRDAAGVVMLVSDPDTGEIYSAITESWLKKSAMDFFVGGITPSARFLWDGTDAEGTALPGGTSVQVDVYAWLGAGDGIQAEFDRRVRSQSAESYSWMLEEKYDAYRALSFPVVIDSQAPVMTAATAGGEAGLVLRFRDDQYLAYASVMDGEGRVLAEKAFETAGGELAVDLSGWEELPDVLYVTVEDYASNTAGYALDPAAPEAFYPTALHLLTDVEDGAWYRKAVDHAVSESLMECDREGRFQPDRSASRMEIVSALYRANGSPAPGMTEADLPFTDLGSLPGCLDSLCWACKQGLVSGRSDGTFDGSAGVTRQELAVMLYRGANPSGAAGGDLSAFSDAGSVAGWARDAVAWAVETGLLQGSGGKLSPTVNVTRAETAQILQRFLAE